VRPRVPRFPTVDHFEDVKSLIVGGAREKNVLRDPESGQLFIAKLGGRNSDLEVTTEYIIHLIGRALRVQVARARLAWYQGRLRFLSEYFLNEPAAEELVHGLQLFKELYDERTVSEVIHDRSREQEMFSVQSIEAAFVAHYYEYGTEACADLFDGFVAMLAHDALIGVQDRHHENWGIIVRRNIAGAPPRFAPLFDSARGLFCSHTDERLKPAFLSRSACERDGEGRDALDRYVRRARPLIGFKGLRARGGWHYLTHEQLLGAVYERYPRQRPIIERVLNAYEPHVVLAVLDQELGTLVSGRRKSLILACIRRRMRAIWRAIHDRVG
jgi:hypothetical protein